MKKLFVPVTILALALGTTFTSCNEDDDMDDQSNIVELAQSNNDLSSLVDAVVRAGLVDALSDESASYTVFAPTNAAFATFLQDNGFNSVDDVPVEVLSNILLNHVLVGKVPSNQVATGYANTLATYANTTSNVDMFINTANGVVINGASTVQIVDQEASNGVVHVVDAVIGIPKVPTFAAANPDFSILVQALTRSDLSTNYVDDVLNGDGPFTVFAPTNDAFTELLAELQVSGLADIDAATLEAVLEYHVASGNTLESDLEEGLMVPTVQGGSFTVSLMGGAKITDGAGRETNIIVTDLQGGNGVVHAVDRVLLPS
jgi:uncharacterized surface protein with fasciclin (FAS1) repeats